MASRIARVDASLARKSTTSPASTSASSPSATTLEKPRPRARAQPKTPFVSAFDADTHATRPDFTSHTGAPRQAPIDGVMTQRLAGPTTRSRCGRAAASVRLVHSCCDATADGSYDAAGPPSCASPMITTAFVPRRPRLSTSEGHVSGRVHNTATLGASGRSSTSAKTGCPSSEACFGLTGHTGPANPQEVARFHTISPMLLVRNDAPITAIDCGANRVSRLRTVIAALTRLDNGKHRRSDELVERARRLARVRELYAHKAGRSPTPPVYAHKASSVWLTRRFTTNIAGKSFSAM